MNVLKIRQRKNNSKKDKKSSKKSKSPKVPTEDSKPPTKKSKRRNPHLFPLGPTKWDPNVFGQYDSIEELKKDFMDKLKPLGFQPDKCNDGRLYHSPSGRTIELILAEYHWSRDILYEARTIRKCYTQNSEALHKEEVSYLVVHVVQYHPLD